MPVRGVESPSSSSPEASGDSGKTVSLRRNAERADNAARGRRPATSQRVRRGTIERGRRGKKRRTRASVSRRRRRGHRESKNRRYHGKRRQEERKRDVRHSDERRKRREDRNVGRGRIEPTKCRSRELQKGPRKSQWFFRLRMNRADDPRSFHLGRQRFSFLASFSRKIPGIGINSCAKVKYRWK